MSAPRNGSATAGVGPEVPAWLPRAALGVLLLALAATHVGDAWGWIAAVAALLAVSTPWVQLAWVAMLSLTLSEIVAPPDPADWHPYVVLAGVALAQLLAARIALIPPRALVALRVFARPAGVTAIAVVPCEGLLALALWLRASPHPTWQPAVLVAAVALLGLGALLFVRLLASRR